MVRQLLWCAALPQGFLEKNLWTTLARPAVPSALDLACLALLLGAPLGQANQLSGKGRYPYSHGEGGIPVTARMEVSG